MNVINICIRIDVLVSAGKKKNKKDTANGNEARVFYYTEGVFGLAELENYLSRVSKDFRIFNFLWISIGQNFYGFARVNFG